MLGGGRRGGGEFARARPRPSPRRGCSLISLSFSSNFKRSAKSTLARRLYASPQASKKQKNPRLKGKSVDKDNWLRVGCPKKERHGAPPDSRFLKVAAGVYHAFRNTRRSTRSILAPTARYAVGYPG